MKFKSNPSHKTITCHKPCSTYIFSAFDTELINVGNVRSMDIHFIGYITNTYFRGCTNYISDVFKRFNLNMTANNTFTNIITIL